MKKILLALLAGLLTACGEDPLSGSAEYASRPELQDSQSQFFLAQFGHDPRLILALQEVYGEVPVPALLPAQAQRLPIDRLKFVKALAWGSVQNFESVYRQRDLIDTIHPDLDWSTDGCSTPPGVNFGYSLTFRSACLVHDFGYHNFRVLDRTPQNREQTDQVFYANMKAICDARQRPERPSCYVVAFVYEEGVWVGGGALF